MVVIAGALLVPISISAAEVVGKVTDPAGAPIAGVEVVVQTQSNGEQKGVRITSAISDSSGRYEIHGVMPGAYTFVAGGQTAVCYVEKKGVTIDWGIAPNAPAIAFARRGISTSPDSKAQI